MTAAKSVSLEISFDPILGPKNKFARPCNQLTAFKKGKNVMVTIPNPNTNETNKRFIRVSAKTIWTFNNPNMMKQNTSESV